MPVKLLTTKQLAGRKVVSAKKGKKIGKVRYFVFHPTEKRLVGFTVKRPDAALMFHRKDQFVALNGYDMNGEGQLVVRDDPAATDNGACKALGIDWEACVIWCGMPVMTASGDFLGYVDYVSFDRETGAVHKVTTENGAANDALLGKRTIPAKLVKGFRTGQGVTLSAMGDYHGEDEDGQGVKGAILVSDEALDLPIEGGAAAAAGRATAVVTNKAKQGAGKAKAVIDEHMEQAKPAATLAATKAGEAVNKGAYVAGRQLGRTKGMFSAFKEEFDKAVHEDD